MGYHKQVNYLRVVWWFTQKAQMSLNASLTCFCKIMAVLFHTNLLNQFTNQAFNMSDLSKNQHFKLSVFSPSSPITQLSSFFFLFFFFS